MSDVSSQKFLQLIKVSFDVSTSVVRDFADCKVIGLPEYGGSVIKFLDLKKHDLYHKWQFNKPCCHCGNTFSQHTKDIDKWRFDLLYQIISDRQIVCMKGKGPIKVNGCIQQYCICNIIPRQTISLNEMDISTLSLLLRYCNITLSQLESIQNLNKQRCRLCHAYSTRSLSIDEYDDILQNLENSTLELAMHVNPYYHRSIKEHLSVMKSYDISTEEIKKLEEKVFHELSEMQIANSNLVRNGFQTHASKIEEAKEEIIQNQNTHFAVIREQIQQLTAHVFINLKKGTTDNKCASSEEMNKEKSTSVTQSDTDRKFVDACKTEMCAEQGAKRKRQPEAILEEAYATLHRMEEHRKEVKAEGSLQQNVESEDKSQLHASCKVESKDIDEGAAVQALPDTKLLDSSFSIISAEKKCIFLELKVPSKVLEDKVLFRVALRALIVKISRAGKVDFNKESTITLHLTFNDDLTEDIIKQIQEITNHSNISCTMDGRRKSDDNNPNKDWLKEKLAWHENENVTLMAENCQLFKDIFAQDEDISNLKMHIENLRALMKEEEPEEISPFENRGKKVKQFFLNRRERRRASPGDSGSESMDECGGTVSDDEPEEIGRTTEGPYPFGRRRRREIEGTHSDEIGRTTEGPYPFGRRRRREIEGTHSDEIGRTTEGPYPFVNRRRTGPTDRLVNRRRTGPTDRLVNRRRTGPTDRLASPGDSGSESMDEYGGAVSDDEPEGPPMLFGREFVLPSPYVSSRRTGPTHRQGTVSDDE